MAAEVSSLTRLLAGRAKDGGGEGSRDGDLVTRDFLGGCCGGGGGGVGVGMLPERDGKELVLGLGSPSACENRRGVADLNMAPLCSSVFSPPPQFQAAPQMRSLLSEHHAATLDLRLPPSSSAAVAAAAGGYQSVCTLDKVRSALERARREPPLRKLSAAASPASSSTTTSSAKRLREAAAQDEEGERESKSPSSSSTSSSSVVVQGREDRGGAAAMAAAGCPSCLLYVLISRSDPRCPRCNAAIPLPPPAGKRPRIDLNLTTSSTAPEAPAATAAAANPITTLNFF